jgi:hypothetical protein
VDPAEHEQPREQYGDGDPELHVAEHDTQPAAGVRGAASVAWCFSRREAHRSGAVVMPLTSEKDGQYCSPAVAGRNTTARGAVRGNVPQRARRCSPGHCGIRPGP